ncbi:hypothetical protein [Psychrobacter immobilis]|uniref:hypothetical protein n=1 Tax=Psychrobacter immobilis TaxID=498 RepID=UPI0019196DB8|nr:hypothetical protein [Psychrobacter immobilis]
MQVTLPVAHSIRICMMSAILLMLSMLSMPAQAELPKATMDDYVWEVLDPVRNLNYFDNQCEYDSLVSYRKCLERDLEKHDNKLSEKWGLSERVSREKDTIYIDVPNRSLPLVFRDELFAPDGQSHSYFSLYEYDEKRQLLYVLKSFPEIENTILINLKTGFNQQFDGIDIRVSPNKERITTVERYIGEENITIWQKHREGSYQIVYESDPSELKAHLAFYQNREQKHDFEDVDIEWQGNDNVLVDFYYLINETDDVGYRVRFKLVKADPTSNWQLIPIK